MPGLLRLFFAMTISLSLYSFNDLELSKGLMSANGSFTGYYERINFQNGRNILRLESSASFEYFLKDNLSIIGGLPITWGLAPITPATVGLKMGASFFFLTKNMFIPYVSADLTPRAKLQRGNNNFLLSFGIGGGVLISLNKNVALDIALKPEIYFRLNEQQNWRIEIPFGVIGIRAFF